MTNISLMTAIGFILFMSSGVTGPVNSLYVASLGASYVAIGLLGTVTSLTTILFSYAWGRASDGLGQRKAFLVLSLAILALAYGLMAVAPDYRYLFPMRVLGAVAQAGYGTVSLAFMGDLLEGSSHGRGRRMGLFRGLCSLGFGLTAFVSGSIADRLSIRVPFALAALLLTVAALLALQVREPASHASTPGLRSAMSLPLTLLHSVVAVTRRLVRWLVAVLRGKDGERWVAAGDGEASAGRPGDVSRLPLAPLLISAFLWSLVVGAVYAVWANYMVAEVGYTRAEMSRLWALASLSEFPLMVVAGWLSDRVGRLPMLNLGFLAWSAVFLGYVFVPSMPWILVVQLVRGFAYSAFTATAMTYATEVRSSSQRGRVSGLYGAAGGLGSILGASLGGSLTEFSGFRAMLVTNAALIFGGAIYLTLVVLRRAAPRRS